MAKQDAYITYQDAEEFMRKRTVVMTNGTSRRQSMQDVSRNDNPETPVTTSEDSPGRIVLETTVRLEMDLRGLHGP